MYRAIILHLSIVKILKKKLLDHNSIIEQVMPLLGHQYAPLLEAPKPAPSIPCYNTQVNAIKQLLYYQETLHCVGAHYHVMREA